MARRNQEGLLDLMSELPWWVSVVAAAIAYVGLRYVLPAIPVDGAMNGVFIQVLSQLAPVVALAFLVTAGVSAAKGAVNRRHAAEEGAARQAQGIGACPKCGNRLVLRTAKRGANAGGRFWGCASFPNCRYVQPFGD